MDAYNPFSLEGKTVLVTGASSGIGRATAIECSKMGARVILTARNTVRLEETLGMLAGSDHRMIAADLTSESDLQKLLDQVEELNGIVLCAGVSMLKPLSVLKETDIQQVFAANTFSVMLLIRSLQKKKKIGRNASIVFISSISGNTNIATGLSTYGASKAALSAYMQYVALELSGRGIRANAILPGRVETTLLQNQTMNEEELSRDIARYPLKRYGKSHEIAQAAVYLLSDAAAWVTGTNMIVDGGRSLT